jgi:hypothetical protein
MCELSDMRSVEILDVSSDGVESMVLHDAHHGSRVSSHRLAIVASRNDIFGMGRMYQMRTEPNIKCIGVFRNLCQAKAWLGIC